MSNLIVSTAGVGKTHLAKKRKNIFDLEPARFFERSPEDIISEEAKKAVFMDKNLRNPEYPYNMMKVLTQYMADYDLVLGSFLIEKASDSEFSDYVDKNFEYTIALPKKSGLGALYERMEERGNDRSLIDFFEHWNPILIDEFGQSENAITIENGEYLEDTLLRHNFI